MSERSTSRDSTLYGCKLTTTDLRKLAALANDGFDSPKDSSVMATINDVEIRSKSIDELLGEIDSESQILANISISLTDHLPYKRVYVFFYKGFTGIKINGSDRTWTLGKHAELTDFLSGKINSRRLLMLRIIWWALISLSVAAYVGLPIGVARLPAVWTLAISFALVAFTLLAIFSGRTVRAERRSEIFLHDLQRTKVDRVAVAALIAGTVGALASIAQIVVAILSA